MREEDKRAIEMKLENMLIDYLMNSKIVILRFLGEKLKI